MEKQRWEESEKKKMKSCTPLWHEARLQAQKLKTPTFGALLEVEMSKKCTPLWRETHSQVKMHKAHTSRSTFGSWDVEKVHAVVAQSTFPSQSVQNTYPQVRAGTLYEDFKPPTRCLTWFSQGGCPGGQRIVLRPFAACFGSKTHNLTGSIVRLFPLLPCSSPLPISNPKLLQLLFSRLSFLGNFRLASLIFNWSPLETILRSKIPFEGFILIPKTDWLGTVYFRVPDDNFIFWLALKVLMCFSGESIESQFLAIFHNISHSLKYGLINMF